MVETQQTFVVLKWCVYSAYFPLECELFGVRAHVSFAFVSSGPYPASGVSHVFHVLPQNTCPPVQDFLDSFFQSMSFFILGS